LIYVESFMGQLHCYIPDDVAKALAKKASHDHLSVSKYLAKLVKRDVSCGWPQGYFDQVFGRWEGDVLQRPAQLEYESRENFE